MPLTELNPTAEPSAWVVPTKLRMPAVPPGAVVRPRVLSLFATEWRVALVTAMPGYGKTVAVQQWAATVDDPVAWLSVDLADRDPLSFWTHLLAAVAETEPALADEPARVVHERGVDDLLFAYALCANVVQAQRPLVIVVDGLPADMPAAVTAGLELLVERGGGLLRLVVIARVDPVLPLAKWRSCGWLTTIGQDDLRLGDAEADAIAGAVIGIHHPEWVATANRRVEGWPLALHMALLWWSESAGVGRSPLPLPERELAQWLLGGILAALSDDQRDAMLTLSVLERFDPALCEAMAGDAGAHVVPELLRRGMFLTVVDARSGAMRFHDLVRELLELELGRRDPARRIALHREAARQWRERGDFVSAYHHLSTIGETEAARELLLAPVTAMVDSGDLVALRRFARWLPTQRDITSCDLAVDLATVSLFTDGASTARHWCDQAERLLVAGADPSGRAAFDDDRFLRLHGIRCAAALFDADLDTAMAAVREREALERSTDSSDLLGQRFAVIAARVMLAGRQFDEAGRWIDRAARIDGPPIVVSATVPTLRSWQSWWSGDLRQASALSEAALSWMDANGIGPHHLAIDTLITVGWCRLATGEIAAARAVAARATDDAERLGGIWNRLQAGYLSAHAAVLAGEPLEAVRVLDGVRESLPVGVGRRYADRLDAVEIEAHFALGDVAQARRRLRSIGPSPRASLLAARLELASPRAVAAHLAGHERWPAVDRLGAELLLAVGRCTSGPDDQLCDLLARASADGWVMPFLAVDRRADLLLDAVAMDEIHPPLAIARRRAGRPPRDAPSPGVPQLTARELLYVELLPTHLSYAEIGEALYVSLNTVKSNLKTIYRKLGVSNRADAVRACRAAQLL